MNLDELLGTLWDEYIRITPQARRIHELLGGRGEQVVNDHVALRTFDLDPIDIDSLAAPFLAAGYQYHQDYHFPEKRLYARSYNPPAERYPRVFISQLKTGEFDADLRRVARELAGQVPTGRRGSTRLLLDAPTWGVPDLEVYRSLLAQSEYAAWVAAFGIRVNHFTVFYNALRTFASLEEFSRWLASQGFPMNESGGLVKGSPAELLEQSSTLADRIEWEFAGGRRQVIPSCYYEFARRHVDPSTGEIYAGFIARSADKIFESTDTRLSSPDRS